MNLSPDAVKKIFAEYRAPESIVIAVVGDIKPPETLKLIEKYFGRIPASNEKKNIVPAEPDKPKKEKVEVLSMPIR